MSRGQKPLCSILLKGLQGLLEEVLAMAHVGPRLAPVQQFSCGPKAWARIASSQGSEVRAPVLYIICAGTVRIPNSGPMLGGPLGHKDLLETNWSQGNMCIYLYMYIGIYIDTCTCICDMIKRIRPRT